MEWKIEAGLHYTKKHEWAKQEEGNIAVVGVTDYAQDKLGNIVFVELPEMGTEVEAGDGVVVIESVKAVADTFTPVAGVVVEVNEDLLDQPELINEDPYGAGWIVKIEVSGDFPAADLFTEDEYREHIRREEEG